MKSSQLPFLDCVKAVRAVSTCSLLSALCLGVIPTAASLQAQQSSGRTGSSSGENHAATDAARKAVPVTPSEDSPALSSSLNAPDAGVPVSGGASPVVETSGPLHTCDDGVSAAMEVDAAGMPCWANIRTVDHWNSMLIPEGLSFHGAQRSEAPVTGQSSFVYTVGGFSGFVLPDGNEAKVYGGLGAAAGRIQRPRWQLSMEDAGGLGDEQSGGAHLAGLNRFAVRGTGEVSERLSWQANATNTYGTDALREAAPLDYRMIGEAEAPAADTPTYGLHAGRVDGPGRRHETPLCQDGAEPLGFFGHRCVQAVYRYGLLYTDSHGPGGISACHDTGCCGWRLRPGCAPDKSDPVHDRGRRWPPAHSVGHSLIPKSLRRLEWCKRLLWQPRPGHWRGCSLPVDQYTYRPLRLRRPRFGRRGVRARRLFEHRECWSASHVWQAGSRPTECHCPPRRRPQERRWFEESVAACQLRRIRTEIPIWEGIVRRKRLSALRRFG